MIFDVFSGFSSTDAFNVRNPICSLAVAGSPSPVGVFLIQFRQDASPQKDIMDGYVS